MSFLKNRKVASIVSTLLVVMFVFAFYTISQNPTGHVLAYDEDNDGLPLSSFPLSILQWGVKEDTESNNCGEHHDCGCSVCDDAYR